MKVSTSTVSEILSNLRAYFQGDDAVRNFAREEPFRSELYNWKQLVSHGKGVAQSHKLSGKPSTDRLLERLENNEKTLLEVRDLLVESVRAGKTVSPGAEWLLDNFYLVEEQIVIARKHLPKGYSEELPHLAEGASAGMPRVYDIALEIISHSDGRVDVKSLMGFIAAYQGCTLLTLGELWAIPIMLRLTLIENLRRVAGKIAMDMIDHNLADYWADRMTSTQKEEPANLILIIADMARSKPVLDGAFVAGLTRKLQGKGPALALPLTWMEQQLSASGMSSEELIRQENQKQAADQVSIRNSIETLRFLGATDWRDFVEAVSTVEHILRKDMAGIYHRMDFATRDRYRHAVETLAKVSRLPETEVAQRILDLSVLTGKATDAKPPDQGEPPPIRQVHVGYYLIGKGREQAERAIGTRYRWSRTLRGVAGRVPVTLYLGSIASLSLLAALGMCAFAYGHGFRDPVLLFLLGMLGAAAASQLAVSLVNWLATLWVKPEPLPRMDFSEGIPVEFRTLVAVPTMLAGPAYIEELVEGLEIRFLSNRQEHLHFALLTDFLDADAESLPEDQGLLELARTRIDGLNRKYRRGDGDIFFLLHRSRTWNSREGKWMGYERKRGKLSSLNALILGEGDGAGGFSLICGDTAVLSGVRYVITLDSDTKLPRESAWKFIATMAHPLNQAVFDRRLERVTEGYGILQPRVASSMPKAAVTRYLRMQGDLSGIDPYTRISSDVYQDLFGEGSFIGKGIYDVKVFEEAVNRRLPENRILSHDLLEGCYARSGLLSDVYLYEEGPSQYQTDVQRRHRWIRGDWQIGAWMLPFIMGRDGRAIANRLSALSRWKIFDNLRRSLIPLSLLLLLALGWSLLPLPWFWTSAVALILLLPVLAAALWQLLNKPKDLTLKAHLTETGASLRDALLRFLFEISVLPFEAYKGADAIVRTYWRIVISRRRLLEWTSFDAASRNADNGFRRTVGMMWIAPLAAVACAALLLRANPGALLVASPVLALWFFAPAIAWRLSMPETDPGLKLPEGQIPFLHETARRTWSYFEEFVTAADNHLPPDNYQEQPVAVVAHRTSPTNMGLGLLANLSARDFGYISGGELVLRCENTLRSMLRLERFQGHFYNWYDTVSLQPLPPRYVSTVDSGNLVGHLLTLRQGLLAEPGLPLLHGKAFEGLATTVRIVRGFGKGLADAQAEKMLEILALADRERSSLGAARRHLQDLAARAESISALTSPGEPLFRNWSGRLSLQIKRLRDDLAQSAPWAELLPVPETFAGFDRLAALDTLPTLSALPGLVEEWLRRIGEYGSEAATPEEEAWLSNLRVRLENGIGAAKERMNRLELLAGQCEALGEVEYAFLLDASTGLLRIGYNADDHRKDNSCYDLLASEARLGIFVGISQGKLPQECWFALSRLLTNSGGDPILLSWSGSMFEYLMPQLVMPAYENTLLFQTNQATVKRQIEYAAQRGVPWGISESAYNRVDAALNYQYRAFGVPGLGLKRGLEEDLVIAPYATMLALMVSPGKAGANLQLLSREGFEGEHGFYEAIDYTAGRLPRGKTHSIVKSYMVHHQGMGLLSLAYALLNKPMQSRFVAELRFQATLLLLQERIPRATYFYPHTADLVEMYVPQPDAQTRRISTPSTAMPEIQLLSNSRYHVMITNSGGGYSRWKDMAVTRWREDATQDDRGIFCYVKDVAGGRFWSNTHQPTLDPAERYQATFSQGHAEFRRHDAGFTTETEVVISPEDDMELRRVKITNKNPGERVLEITSYAEIVLASHASDEAHAAFSNLFVQTEIAPEHGAVYCTRRKRFEEEKPPWLFHLMDAHGAEVEAVSYETDRMRFIGRGRSLAWPRAMEETALSGSQGSVLDPIVSIRYRIRIPSGQTATLDLIFGVSETRTACEAMVQKYHDRHLKNRAIELSWTHSQVRLRQINATEADAQLYDRLAASVLFANPGLRAEAGVIGSNFRGQSGLWSHSVSGDLPIVLLYVNDPKNIELVKQLVQAHVYWRLKGLAVDLVIWNGEHGSYRQHLQEQILGLITAEAEGNSGQGRAGRIFVKPVDMLSTEDRVLFESVARVIIHDGKGTLAEQMDRQHVRKAPPPPLLPAKTQAAPEYRQALPRPEGLRFFNGIGGFSPDGKEYKIWIEAGRTTPAPWVNVIANPEFGSVVSESGSAYTWAANAHEYRLTPWSNDPVSDRGGEAFYIRDEESGRFWSPTPFPAPGRNPYVTTHGFGYSAYEHIGEDIRTELRVFVDVEAPIKFMVLKVRNLSGRARRLSVMAFMDMVLGDLRAKTHMHVISEREGGTGALLLRNRYNSAFAERVTFFRVDGIAGIEPGYTADRSEFIGRNRNLADPQALSRQRLANTVGAGFDPCAALQVKFDLLDGSETEIVFQLGTGENAAAALALLRRFSGREAVRKSFDSVKAFWKENLEAVQVATPDASLDILANGWLMYQTMACRLFARSGFYQSGGAFGFRDQLQDVLAMLHTRPDLARRQILLSASRQFPEGDVQHWWHPPEGRGVRTRCSDDLLWLPYAVSRYVAATGDRDILALPIGFLECRPLHPEEDSLYDLPISGNLTGTLYEHCVRAIGLGSRLGDHGLPLIGSGDWNDGMDRVGNKGKGESVWLAFFLHDVLVRFSDVARVHGDAEYAAKCLAEAAALRESVDASCWDGEWYLRAFFDDGTPLGSKVNDECRIDAIAQSWSVLSGAAPREKRDVAMASLDRFLVKRDLKLIQLLDPPFDSEGVNPGYIKGYVPGVRENGGQYSHAAVWALMAFAAQGDRAKVWEMFSLVNPMNHALDAEAVQVYKVEPYVMAADVYANEDHRGRGGWTWYTGSSGWMYQFMIGSLLGLQRKGDRLEFSPCFPLEWPSVSIAYRFGNSRFRITLFQSESLDRSWWKSGDRQGEGNAVELVDDGREHEVEVHYRIPSKASRVEDPELASSLP